MNAYITYSCSDSYIPGIIAVYKSLRHSGNTKDLVVMVTDDVTDKGKELLKDFDIKFFDVDKIHYKGGGKVLSRYRDNAWKMFTKLNIWKQTQYEKLVYLDADTLILKNIDDLFEYDELSAVHGGSQMLGYSGIEGGILVIKPNEETFDQLIKSLDSDEYDIRMSDQSFLNDYFTRHGKITHLPETYNRRWKKRKDFDTCHIYHFNADKPWISPERIDQNSLSLWNYYFNLEL